MRRLVKTTDGWFVKDGASVYKVDASSEADLLAATAPEALNGDAAAVSGEVLAPVQAAKLVMVGLNFHSHAEETNSPVPEAPIFGEVPASSITATGGTTERPAGNTDYVDYEGEIVAIIGKPCDNIAKEDVPGALLGLTACNDLSARDLQIAAIQSMGTTEGVPDMSEAKGFTKAKPLGPEVLLTDGKDPATLDLTLTTKVSGEQRQSGHISDMIFSVSELVAEISKTIPLAPGDLVSTGTPAGVGLPTGNFLKGGDVVEIQLGDMPPLVTTIA